MSEDDKHDELGEKIADLLPPDVESMGMGGMWFADYPHTTLGEFKEYVSFITVTVDEEGGAYIPHIYVDNDAALAAEREVLGAPKKFAHIKYEKDVDCYR